MGKNGDALEQSAGDGGGGAPPEIEERNRAPKDLTRAYQSAAIRVLWFAERCVHAGECVMALPEVFDPWRRPWVDVDAASADEIAGAVQRCPTGALHYVRLDGGPSEPVPAETTVRILPNGPYLIRGKVGIFGSDGALLREDTRVALCRCGRSLHMPFCDNSHRATGFRDPS